MLSKRTFVLVSTLPIAAWTVFHLWEQWSLLSGREGWLARMSTTSRGPIAIAIEVVVVIALAAWIALAARAAVRREAQPSAAREGDAGLLRALGAIGPYATAIAIVFVVVHVGELWLPKIVRGASLLETYATLAVSTGTPAHLVLYAFGIVAVAWHLAASAPDALVQLGAAPASRRSLALLASVTAICFVVLAVQLTGWVATGTGTLWPIDVVQVPD